MKPVALPVTFARSASHPFHAPRSGLFVKENRRTALPVRLGSPRGWPRRTGEMSLTDFCNRLTTRAPTDRSTSERTTLVVLSTGSFPDRDRVRPSGAKPSFDDSASARKVLDDTFSASVDSLTKRLRLTWRRSCRTPPQRRHFGAAFSTAREVGEPPLTPPVAPGSRPENRGLPGTRTASTALTSMRAASPIRGAFHRQVLSGGAFAFSVLVCESPPPVSRLCRRGAGFRRAFATPNALARRG